MSMTEFFSDGETQSYLTPEQIQMLEKWRELSEEQQELLIKLIDNMKKED